MDGPQNVGERVAAILAHRLQVEGISESTDLFEASALDSLGLVELLVGLEEEFGIAISAEDLELDRFRSIAAISAFVSSKIERRNGHDLDDRGLGPRRIAVK
jgi:acyl carrier protein